MSTGNARQVHVVQTLVEAVTKCEVLQATWQTHVAHALVEDCTKCEHSQATRQAHVVHAPQLITRRRHLGNYYLVARAWPVTLNFPARERRKERREVAQSDAGTQVGSSNANVYQFLNCN